MYINMVEFFTAICGATADSDAVGWRVDCRIRQWVDTPGGGGAPGSGGGGFRLYLDMVHAGMGHRGR